MTRADAHKIVDMIFDAAGSLDETETGTTPQPEDRPEERKLPEGKKAVRTKSTGDRVYVLDEEKKTRQWVTNPDVLRSLGFELGDVAEVDDTELLKYQMGQALYRVDEPKA
jgi:hypothetical protein